MTGDATRRVRTLRARVLAGAFGAAVAVVGPVGVQQAFAATSVVLMDATPGIGDAVGTAPAAVTLTFDQNLTKGTISVSGPSGDAAGGAAGIYGARLTEPLATGLPAGTYTVSWVAKAKGTPKSKGSYTFRVTGSTPSTTPTPTPTAPTPTSSATSGGGVLSTLGVPPTVGTTSPAGTVRPPLPTGADSAPAGTARPGSTRAATAPAVAPVGGTGAPTSGPTPTAAPLPSTGPVVAEEGGARKAVNAVVSGSRAVGLWLIAAAVALQVGAAVWGLWQWRRGGTQAPGAAGEGDPGRPSSGPPEPGERPVLTPATWADRPWTGELPVRRDQRESGGAPGVPPA